MTPTRRSNGEGSKPYQRPDGRWQIKIRTTQTATGTPLRKTIYGKTRAEAVAKARAYTRQLENGLIADSGKQTLHQWAEQWLTLKSRQVRPQTLKAYRGYLERWAYPTPVARKKLNALKPKDIEAVYERMRTAGVKESTVHHMHRIFKICLKSAVDNDLIYRSPMDRVSAPVVEPFEPVVLTPAKSRELIAAAALHPNAAALTLNLALGLRQGERLGLCWSDIDFEQGTMNIERTTVQVLWRHGCERTVTEEPTCGMAHARRCPQKQGGGFRMGPTKNKAGTRLIPVPRPLLEQLRTHKLQQRKQRLETGPAWTGAKDVYGKTWDLVFTDRLGRCVRPNDDWKVWHEFTTENGVENMRVHDARHTAATVLLSMRVSPQVTMDIMGWSSPSMLAKYQHVLDEMKQDAVNKVSDALFG